MRVAAWLLVLLTSGCTGEVQVGSAPPPEGEGGEAGETSDGPEMAAAPEIDRTQGDDAASGGGVADSPEEGAREPTEPLEVEVTEPPPAPRVEVRPRSPGRHHVWIEGRWEWRGNGYGWVDGRWTRPRRGWEWVRPRWERRGGSWVYHRGHWRPQTD